MDAAELNGCNAKRLRTKINLFSDSERGHNVVSMVMRPVHRKRSNNLPERILAICTGAFWRVEEKETATYSGRNINDFQSKWDFGPVKNDKACRRSRVHTPVTTECRPTIFMIYF